MADSDAKSNGNIDAIVKSRLNTSIAKMIAAIGALKMDDIAPAAAQPMSSVRVVWFTWNNLAMLLLMAAPVATVGPSSPTEPPKPTVMGAVRMDPNICVLLIIPFFLDMEWSVEGIP